MFRCRKRLIIHELRVERRSVPIDLRMQTNKDARLLLQIRNSGKLVTVPNKVGSLDDLDSHRALKEMDGEILHSTVVQRSKREMCGLGILLRGDPCTSMSVASQVGFKV